MIKSYKIVLIHLFILILLFILIGCGNTSKKSSDNSSTQNQPIVSNTPITLQEITQREKALEGKMPMLYRAKLEKNKGSFVIFNFYSIKKYESYIDKNKKQLNNVIVIENVPSIELTEKLISNAAKFRLYDINGNEIKINNIDVQAGKEFSEIVIKTSKASVSAYMLVDGVDETTTGSSKLIYPIK